jgi:hypothetical protein
MKFVIDDDILTIKFEGLEQVWAFKRRLIVPRIKIERAVWQPGVVLPRGELGLRVGGTGLPSVLYAGRFAGRDGLNFVYLKRPQYDHGVKLANALTLEMRDYRYQRIILTIDDPAMATDLIAWWSGNV